MAFSQKTIVFAVASIFIFGYLATATAQLDDFLVIGSVNNKTFYTPKNDTTMNWFSADGLCTYFGLEIAMFKTSEEFQFVRSHVPDNHTKLWIGAHLRGQRIYRGDEAFQWVDGSDIAIPNFHQFSEHFLCLIFSQDDHLYTDFCLAGQYKPLCQNKSSTNSTSV